MALILLVFYGCAANNSLRKSSIENNNLACNTGKCCYPIDNFYKVCVYGDKVIIILN